MHRIAIVALLGAYALCASCENDGGQPSVDVVAPIDVAQPADVASTDLGGGADIQASHEYRLVFLNPDPIELYTGDLRDLRVQLTDLVSESPVEGVMVAFELDGPEEGDAELVPSIVETDEHGMAAVSLRAGEIGDVDYRATARVQVDDAPPLDFVVDISVAVAPLLFGNLEILFTYDGEADLRSVRVGLLPMNELTCNDFDAQAPWEALAERTTPSWNSGVLFQDLEADERYLVFVTARNEEGNLAARGCAEDIYVSPNTNSMTILCLGDIQ